MEIIKWEPNGNAGTEKSKMDRIENTYWIGLSAYWGWQKKMLANLMINQMWKGKENQWKECEQSPVV